MKRKPSISHDQAMTKKLRENPDFAVDYLRSRSRKVMVRRFCLLPCAASLNQEAALRKSEKTLALSGRAFIVRCRPKEIHGSHSWLP